MAVSGPAVTGGASRRLTGTASWRPEVTGASVRASVGGARRVSPRCLAFDSRGCALVRVRSAVSGRSLGQSVSGVGFRHETRSQTDA